LETDVFDRAASLWRKLTHHRAAVRPSAAIAEEDRRLWVRRHVSIETQVTPTSGAGEPPLSARILDVSSGGIKLLVRWAFGPGDLLTVELPSRAGGPSVTVLACVAHSQLAREAEWVVGCRFSAELSEADLATFGAFRSKSALPDSRTWSRYPCEVKAIYQVVPEDDEDVRREAKVLNISPGGVALSVDHDVSAGALLSAELHASDGRPVVTILACVVHVTVQSEQERILGCNFIQELGEDDLQALS
jgi:hypothetical protein